MPSRKSPTPPPVYRPQPTPKVLQKKTVPGRPLARPATPGLASAATRQAPSAPAAYKPQPTPRVLQKKRAVPQPAPRAAIAVQPKVGTLRTPVAAARQPGPPVFQPRMAQPKIAQTKIAQLKAAMSDLKAGARIGTELKASWRHSANVSARPNAPRRFTRTRAVPAQHHFAMTIQRAAAPYHAWMRDKRTFIAALEEDHYLLQGLTANVFGTVTNAHQTVRNLKGLDMTDAGVVHSELKDRLTDLISSVHIRPATPTHDNLERNLPTGRTYYELGMEGGGGARIIYDSSNSDIYFSYHYGGNQNGANLADSPFIRLANLTAGQRAVTKYKILFFELETAAYKKALKMKGHDWAVAEKLAGIENTLDGLANTASNYFNNVLVPPEPAIDAVITEMWRLYNRAKINPKAGFAYLNACIGVMKQINATHTL